VLAASPCRALDINEDPGPQDYFFAKGMGFPVQRREKVFPADENRANFTFFDGAEDARVRGGKLAFTLTASKATLGWGNYAGKQPVAEIHDMWQQTNIVRLRARQSDGPSRWTARLWRDGRALKESVSADLEGQDWEELEFRRLDAGGTNPDGLEFTVQGRKGTRFDIEWVKLVQPVAEGYCRAEFALPPGRVWRAIADVGYANERHWSGSRKICSRLHINGKVVERRASLWIGHTAPVDIAPFLRPGRNCVGFYGFRIGNSLHLLYFQAKIVMDSGAVVTVRSGRDWKFSPREAEGWSRPGFDDSGWGRVRGGPNPRLEVRDSADRSNIPAYAGRLLLKNPNRRDLFYTDTQDVVAEVHMPPGLGKRQPTLSYLLGRVLDAGTCELAKQGAVSSAAERGGSSVYRLALGRQEHGVYALALSLKAADGAVIEERRREPLVVLREVPQRLIEGKEYTEGLDLELEDSIDFTDPKDPHPCVEGRMPEEQPRGRGRVAERVTQPRIVRKGGLPYRETAGATRFSGFSCRVELKHPGSFYLIEVEYPDDDARLFGVTLSDRRENVFYNTQSSGAVETGGRFLPTGRMRTLRWVHLADVSLHAVIVLNLANGRRAAAKSIKIHRIRGDLPSVGSGAERRYGIYTERCFYRSGIGKNFGIGQPKSRADEAEEERTMSPMQLRLRDLAWMKEAGERYIQYLRFSGQNCHHMGCYQYCRDNTPFVPAPFFNNAGVLPCPRTMMANLFELNGIDFYAGIQFRNCWLHRTYANDAQVAKGAPTMWRVDTKGKQYAVPSAVPNFLWPEFRRDHHALVRELGRTFGHLKRFRGVHAPLHTAMYYTPGFADRWYRDFLDTSYDDLTFSLFERETGVKLRVRENDPDRFEARAKTLKDPALRQRFVAWRAGKVTEFLEEATRVLRGDRTDLDFFVMVGAERYLYKEWTGPKSGRPYESAMLDLGIDLKGLMAVPGLWVGRYTVGWEVAHGAIGAQDPYQ